MLSHEETRRRVSVDYALTHDQLQKLTVEDGVVIPISVLSKEPRKKFDLRDESGRAVPVLGREQNGDLAHIALMSAALEALGEETPSEVFEMLAADLRQIVFAAPQQAADAFGFFTGSAEAGDRWRAAVVEDETCQALLNSLWANYVLFAVLPSGGASRRILKYSYADDFDLSLPPGTWRQQLAPSVLAQRVSRPDRKHFKVQFDGAWRAASFHAEVAIAEELRFDFGVLFDEERVTDRNPEPDLLLSSVESDVDRLSVYASSDLTGAQKPAIFLEVSAEQAGRPSQAAATSLVVAGLLWLGVRSGLDAQNPGAAVSTLLAGAALFTGFEATQGRHRLVRKVFAAPRRWLAVVTLTGLTASASLAMEYPKADPVRLWRVCAIICSISAARLLWSAVRAPS
jgi:hypothetical protein